MTFAELVTNYCTERGMWPEQAEAVLGMVKADPVNASMQGRWDDDVTGYHSSIAVMVRMSINKTALEWIDANQPQAFFRPMFDPGMLVTLDKYIDQ
jgi:hypothetical protein